MKAVALSHLQSDPTAARVGRFTVSTDSESLEFPEFVNDWDPETDLMVRVELGVDLALLLTSAGLPARAGVGVLVRWTASGSGLRGASDTHELRDGTTVVEFPLEGALLGGSLELQTLVVLTRAHQDAEPLAATEPGSLLWEQTRKVRLEGEGGRFPISHVSFAETGLAGGLEGAWMLHFESADLSDSGVGNMRLYLNTDHPTVQQFLEDPSSLSHVERIMRHDVQRQMLMQALNHEELDLDVEYPTESMGEMFVGLVRRIFPHNTLDEVRSLARNSPGEFEAHVQARGGFLR